MKTAVMEATVLHQKATLTVALQAAVKEAVMVRERRKRHQVIVIVVVAEAGAKVITIQVMVGVAMEVGVMEAHHQTPHQEVAVVVMVVAVVTVVIPHLAKTMITSASIYTLTITTIKVIVRV